MKKYLLTIILFILVIPTVVLAGTCNPSDIEIKSVTLSKTLGTAEEVTAASVDNKSINIDVKLNNPNDSMEYDITVKNNSTEDYYIKEQDFNNNQYLKYEFVHENNSIKIAPSEEKDITLRVSYVDRVEGNSNYTTTDNLSLNILDKQDISVANTLKNLSIGFKILIIFILCIILFGLITLLSRKKESRNLLLVLLILALFIPINTDASCDAKIDVTAKVELDNKNAVFINGVAFNLKMKALAGTNTSSSGEYTYDTHVTAFRKSNTEPAAANKEDKNIVSASDSELPIYIWYESGTIYWWSEDDTPSLGEDAEAFFAYYEYLTDIDGAKYIDTSKATNVYSALCGLKALADFTPFANWNTSNWTRTDYMFYNNVSMTNIDFASNWDLSKANSLYGFFNYCKTLENIDGALNWNIKSITTLAYAFHDCEKLQNLNGASNWDVSNVTDMEAAFCYCYELSDLSGIANWNVSKVENMSRIFVATYDLANLNGVANWKTTSLTNLNSAFYSMTNLIDISGLTNWDTSNVTDMYAIFSYDAKLVSATALAKWDVSNVTNMYYFFYECTSLTTVDVSKWNTSNVENMGCMFYKTAISELDLSSWNTKKVTNFKWFFWGSNNLTTVYIGENWDISANTEDQNYFFPDTCHLPNFSTSNTNFNYITWAKPTTEGGYLTLKTNE